MTSISTVSTSALRRLLPAMLLCLFFGLGMAPGSAWSQDDEPSADQRLDTLRQQITGMQNALKGDAELTDAALSKMKADAQAASIEATKVATELGPQLASVQARQAELGKPVAGSKEDADVAAQRNQLDKQSSALDSQVKLARLLTVEADQASEQVSTVRRQELQARLGERSASLLSSPLWVQVRAEWPQNLQRLATLGGDIGAAARNTGWKIWSGLVAAMLLTLGLRYWAARYLMALTTSRVPHGRLRRSVHALALTGLSVATPAVIATLLKLGINWNATLPDKTAAFLGSSVGVICFGGYVAGLGYALLSPGRPSWRLLELHDRVAQRMRQFPLVFAVVMVLTWSAERVAVVVNAGLSTAVLVNCVVALMLSAIAALGLLRAERMWGHIRRSDAEQTFATPFWLRSVVVLMWVALATTFLSVLIGYVAFGSFVAKQVCWIVVIVASTYLLAVLVDDICMLLASTAPDPDARNPVLATPKARDQAAVLLSGVGRLLVVLMAAMILLAPFGEGPAELWHRVSVLHDGLAIGEIQIRPGALIQALLVLVFGFLGLRLLKQWLEKSYLPTTNLDSGMQMSALTLFGYTGGILAVALALSAVGIGLERIAWVASALSVGIGFGLQAVVQNFVSGIILLAERPVKVGDWVSLGGVEGDIRRINVRATEIQMGDRSTVIVPNSEFITKTVRNITHASPLGLVQIKLPLPLSTDADEARDLILGTFADNSDVLESPAPAVLLDGIDNGFLMFNATGFVNSPRNSGTVRSALLFELLKRLRAAEMPISKPSTMLLSQAPALLSQPSPLPPAPPAPLVP